MSNAACLAGERTKKWAAECTLSGTQFSCLPSQLIASKPQEQSGTGVTALQHEGGILRFSQPTFAFRLLGCLTRPCKQNRTSDSAGEGRAGVGTYCCDTPYCRYACDPLCPFDLLQGAIRIAARELISTSSTAQSKGTGNTWETHPYQGLSQHIASSAKAVLLQRAATSCKGSEDTNIK